MQRVIVNTAAWVAIVLASVAAAAEKDTWAGVDRIVSVGDIHGDFDQFVKVLRAAEVIDEKDNWIAGKAHLVQTGDVLDRGPDSRKAMDLLVKLEGQAAAAGGAVHALIGNHEVMVLLGELGYMNPKEAESYGGREQYAQAMSAEGKYGKWIRGHNAAIKINDIVFVHAGIAGKFSKLSLAEINKSVRSDLEKGSKAGLAMDPAGPLWDRSVANAESAEAAKRVQATLKNYGANHMVVGHTTSIKGILVLAGGGVIRTDVGLSKVYDGPAACLVVEKGEFFEVRAPKEKTKLEVAVSAPVAASQPAATRPQNQGLGAGG